MRCPNCGHRNDARFLYCTLCGRALKPLPGSKRFATVVFFDLSGFTAFTHGYGPDDAWQRVEPILDAAQQTVTAYGGQVEAIYGDGLLAVFGLRASPVLKARQAVEAALAMVAQNHEVEARAGARLLARAAVTSGIVLAAPMRSENGRERLFGDPVNRAQRIVQATPAGEVVIDETTAALLPEAICEPLKPLKAKGFPTPIKAFYFRGWGRGAPQHPYPELAAELETRWRTALASRPTALVFVAPPGSGERLLISGFFRSVEAGRKYWLPPLSAGISLRAWLGAFLKKHPEVEHALLSLPLTSPEARALAFVLGKHREAPPLSLIFRTLAQALAVLSQREPWLLVVENIHHAAPVFRTFLHGLRKIDRAKLLIIATARTGAYPYAKRISPLTLEKSLRWLRQINPTLDEESCAAYAALADGLADPLRHLAKTPGEAGLVAALQPYFDAVGAEAREALLFSALLREVQPALLESVLGLPGEKTLQRLTDEGFLQATGAGEGGKTAYRFRAEAYRRAAKALLPLSKQQSWHRQIADWLAKTGKVEAAERVADHLEAAGDFGPAIRVLRAAAQQTRDQDVALRLLKRAFSLAQSPAQQSRLAIDLARRLLPERPGEALEVLNHARGTEALKLRGLAHLGRGNPDRSRACLERYLRDRPNDHEAHLGLGKACASLGDLPSAADHLSRALEAYRGRGEREAAAHTAIELAGVAWRARSLDEAIRRVGEAEGLAISRETKLLASALRASYALDQGAYIEAQRRLEKLAPLLKTLAPGRLYARIAAIRLRYLIETGKLGKALSEGEYAWAVSPDPWLGAVYALALALAGKTEDTLRLSKTLAGQTTCPHTQAFLNLAQGFAQAVEGAPITGAFKRALRYAQKAKNPYATFLSLAALAIDHRDRAPQKTSAIASYLLPRTGPNGFLPFYQFARLLKAEANLRLGKPVLHLLAFESSFAPIELWRRSLAVTAGRPVHPLPKARLLGYGILGLWAYNAWSQAWTRGRSSAAELTSRTSSATTSS